MGPGTSSAGRRWVSSDALCSFSRVRYVLDSPTFKPSLGSDVSTIQDGLPYRRRRRYTWRTTALHGMRTTSVQCSTSCSIVRRMVECILSRISSVFLMTIQSIGCPRLRHSCLSAKITPFACAFLTSEACERYSRLGGSGRPRGPVTCISVNINLSVELSPSSD